MDLVQILNFAVAFFMVYMTVFFLLLFVKYRREYYTSPEWKGQTPFISIVVPAYNESELIEKCLDSLLKLDYPKNKLEIIVINDGSTDDTEAKAKNYESHGINVYTKENGGKGAALNYGIQKATGEFVATMDADSHVTPQVIKELLPYFDDPDVMAATPSIKVAPGSSPIKEFQRIEYLMILFSRKLLSYIESVPVTPGPFSMFRKVVFDKVGLFDEDNLVEDQEIAMRIQANHFKIRSSVEDDATVYTDPPDNLNDLLKQRVRWQRGGIRNYWKYRHLVKSEFGDYGMFFIPLNFATLTAFFIVLALLLNSFFTYSYYAQYIAVESVAMSVNVFTIVGIFAILMSLVWLYTAVSSFKTEKIKLRYLLLFMLFYWYLMMSYNILMAAAEIRGAKRTW